MAKPTLSEISKLFKTDDKPTDFHYYGTVVSSDVENRTYEVSINRDENITVEAARLVGAHVGDTVMVTVMANGYATVTGRVGGDTDASDAQRKADSASDIADEAQRKAVNALGKATAAEQLASQAEQNAKRSADAAELAEENAGKSADYASESKTASEQAQQAAELAQQNAADSQTAAETAQQNAAGSQTAAERARDRAAAAEGYADTAQKQAAKAEKEASAANSYAVGALNSLSTTQDIMGVLSWVEESIKYVWDYPPTVEDKEYDPSKQYYTVIGKRVIGPIETDYDKYYVLNSESEPASKTGNIVTFDSDLDNFPLKSLTATINPKQDLHGYDKPWVGGAGKNLFNYAAVTGLSSLTNNNGVFTNPDVDTRTAFELCVQQFNGSSYVKGDTLVISASGRYSVVFTVDSEITKLRIKHNGASLDFKLEYPFTKQGTFCISLVVTSANPTAVGGLSFEDVMIESGSVMTTYEPYSNICPISGWDSVEASVTGVNVWDEEWEVGGIRSSDGTNSTDANRIRTKNLIPIVETTYYVKAPSNLTAFYYDMNNDFMESKPIGSNATFIPINGAKYMRFTVGSSSNPVTTYNNDISINYPSTDTGYHAYTGTTYTTDLPETVYGGSLDVVNGVLTVDRAMVDLGSLAWQTYGSGDHKRFGSTGIVSVVVPPSADNVKADILCDSFAIDTATNVYNHVTDNAVSVGANGNIYAYTTQYATPSDFKTAVSGVYICYELATPLTHQLTPKQVTTLLGTNNVWSDSGDVTVEYWDGPVGYVTPTSSFDPTETYYTVKGSPVKIDESKQDEHGKGLYYVHDLTNAKEAMADFIKAHLALNDEGLYVLKGPNDWRVLVANDGVYIIDPQGRKVASYGEDIAFDSQRPHTIGNENQYVKYYQDEEDEEYKIAINADSITLGSSTIPTTEETIRQASDAQKQAEANAKAYADDALESFTSRFTVSPEEISSEVSGFQDGAAIVSRINQLPDSVKIEAKNVEIIDKYESYIELAAAEAAPYILLGKRDNNAMLLRITNKRMGFEVNSEEVAYLAPDALHVQKQISFGDFIMKQRENGHLSIIRVTRGG